MRLGTIAAGIVGAVAALAWLVKDRLTGPSPAGNGAPKAVAPPPAAPPPPPEPAGDDDLSAISGIGPVYRTRLADAGITSFAALAAADASEVAEQIEAPVSRVQAWIDASRRHHA
jgi:predicted flap endonuclease-1-like 5' DNA nuclease